jgi:hypothetical protein
VFRWLRLTLEEILCVVLNIQRDVKQLLRWIALKEIDFAQVGGCMNNSIVRGTPGTFIAVLTPANGAQAPGTVPQWGADDPSVVLTPTVDGLTCTVQAPVGSTVTTFNLSIRAVSSDPTIGTVSNTHPITVTEPVAPPLTAIDFTQTAG